MEVVAATSQRRVGELLHLESYVAMYYCCGKTRDFARHLFMRDKTCNICKAKEHLARKFEKTSRGARASVASGGSGIGKPPVPAIKPKLLTSAKGTKKDAARDGAEVHSHRTNCEIYAATHKL